jgi:hypothetical protein
MRSGAFAILAVLIAACAGAPPAPDWQSNAHLALRNFEKSYLSGDSRAADAEFARARAELSSTGRLDLLARAELTRCAVQVASLVFDECPGFTRRREDAGVDERVYADYLAARWQSLEVTRLPPQHRSVVAGGRLPTEPLARLVAAGALFRAGRLSPEGIAAAIDAASSNGWRRPLLAWLGVEEKRATNAGDPATAALVRRRIETVLNGGK